ncbi:hypothetical protein AG0111_0g12363 [Alternaria gaisen]|uniref:Uncharacterized protein n=1 Tax=Alternaria gaisen TaxID=167740 RepID=A0ACB6F4X9_9PLEO|nr:hypothetical protein AG0111_0g12363 [Alternaria gaisen]
MAFLPYTKTFHRGFYARIDPSRPELSTSGKVVLITGGGSEGDHAGVTIHAEIADIADTEAVSKAFEGASKALGKIDIVIGNAGYLPDTKPIAQADTEEWFRGMTTNVKGTPNLTKSFLQYAAEKPTFVHVSTGGCHIEPMPANSGYAVSKMAAARLMEYFAFENPHVRVHNIHPGVVQTEMFQKSSELVELPASVAVWIVSPEAEFLKGKFVWSNWDVEELKAKKEQLKSSQDLTLGLLGWP